MIVKQVEIDVQDVIEEPIVWMVRVPKVLLHISSLGYEQQQDYESGRVGRKVT